METIEQYFQYSQLAMAAYGLNLEYRSDIAQAYQDAGFTQSQAEQLIADGWEVISQSSDALYGDSSFSATLFKNTKTGEYVFANKGTLEKTDLFTDAWGIATLGAAGSQIIDMYRYYKQLITPAGASVVYSADEIERLHEIGVFYAPGKFATTGEPSGSGQTFCYLVTLQNAYNVDVGNSALLIRQLTQSLEIYGDYNKVVLSATNPPPSQTLPGLID